MDVYGLIGNPVGHSLSPPMHEAAYRELGLDAAYVTFEPDSNALGDAIAGGTALGIRGLNVTIPFKRDVLDYVEPDSLAARIGAVNTIDFAGEIPSGHNTDAAGAERALRRHDVPLDGREFVLLGAGGAARAIAFALADNGANIAIANRTERRAHELAAELTGASGNALEAVPSLLESADTLINATSVGMEADRSPVPTTSLHDGLTVMDIVYRPVRTRLLRDAESAGARTIDGGWMLLYQGVEAFEIWTGLSAPVDEMNVALREKL